MTEAAAEELEGSCSGAANNSDLQTSGILPMLPMLDEDKELSSGKEEGSGDQVGSPQPPSNTTPYSLFPGANPGSATWQEQDLNRDMHCENDSATFFFTCHLRSQWTGFRI